MLMEMDDGALDEIEEATAEIESLSGQLATASPSGVEAIAEQIGAQVARLRAARVPALPAEPVAEAPDPAPAPDAPLPPAVPDPAAPVAPAA